MRGYRLQNRVAGSVFTLPVCAAMAVVVWWLPDFRFSMDAAWGLLLATLVTYVLLETNNRFQMIRIRTRMVASTWVVSASAIAMLHTWSYGMIAALSLAVSHFCLFSTYEKRQPVGETFHAGLFLGIGTLFVPWLVFLFPLYVWHQGVFLRSMSWRCLFALLIGGMFPAMVVAVPSVLANDFGRFLWWWHELTSFVPIVPASYLDLTLQQALAWVFPFLLILLGSIHYLCTSFNDKISVRMVLYVLVVNGFVLQTFAMLQPQHLDVLLPSVLVCGVTMIAHFYALTSSWFTNFLFILVLMGYVAMGYFTMVFPVMKLSELIIR